MLGNYMHVSCLHHVKVKKIKPINPEEQPIICQFIVDSAISQTSLKNIQNPESKGKKRRGLQEIKIPSTKNATLSLSLIY